MMKHRSTTKLVSILVCIVLVAAMALCITGCDKKPQEDAVKKSFTFLVVDPEGKETSFQITTSKSTVGEALMDEGLISGEEGPYGLYVLTVNGLTLKYEEDGMYWAFYEGENYAITGVELTPIDESIVYSFRAESA
jgi:hypothetical protein